MDPIKGSAYPSESLPIWCCPPPIPPAHSALIFHPVKTLKGSSHTFVPLLSIVGGLLPGFLLWTPSYTNRPHLLPHFMKNGTEKAVLGGHENSVSTPPSYLGPDQSGEPRFPIQNFLFSPRFLFLWSRMVKRGK